MNSEPETATIYYSPFTIYRINVTPERWQQVEEILQRVLDRPPPDRVSFLDQVCRDDAELRAEAASLINAYDEAGDFIEVPAFATDARILLGGESEHQIGREIGPYTIRECLGVGGMGEVYLAHDGRLGRLVALKILPVYFASDDARLRRFQREAQAASALNHPNILTIHEVGETDETRFIATEFIEGDTVRELIDRRELSREQILDIADQVASALAAAHAAGIVHRDIKPENIMRRRDGLVKILDFGIAKLVEPPSTDLVSERALTKSYTEIGVVMGTVGYMSPEQARAQAVDERTDVWSLGVVLYEMLTGQLPFPGATRMDTMVSILEREPTPLAAASGHPDEFQRVIDKALRKDRDDRYQSAAEFAADLKSIREHPKVAPVAKPKADRSSLRPAWFNYFLILGAVVLLLAVGGTILYRRLALRERNAASAVTTKSYLQMSDAEQMQFIAKQEQRISQMMGDHRGKPNEEAVRAIKAYLDYRLRVDRQTNGEGDGSLRAVYGRAGPYVPLIARSFAARKVPIIIGIYLPVIESGFRPCYENAIGAKGLFQFVPETAKNYGVARDEMCDAEKMTPAAAHYIADRMAELGEDSESVTLVLLSYNRGAESVREMLRQLRGTDNYERNFWMLYAHRNELGDTFRNESAGYVPNFFAAAIIGENPQAFGLNFEPLSTMK
ncbi:MAG: eukaryotic-like serine/threonine-protein kinase [Blastocatellia bacterium]|nr:eukaryotic-like serine/threonine-protein kinase [Blastocatellia bacterium]